ncbi:MAG: hypothetical protein INF91_09650 [Alphaproteobacteria bacterium]|nr:hypothetical protein [Alphaproteobacteria bacterium]
MDLETTVAMFAASATLLLWSLWGVRRKRPFGTVSIMPWHGMMLVGILLVAMLGAHLLSLLTGAHLPMPGYGGLR